MKTRKEYIQMKSVILYTMQLLLTIAAIVQGQNYLYAVVISSGAYETSWSNVADSLIIKHNKNGTAKLFKWITSVTDVKEDLSQFKPDYIAYIARPALECNSAFIVNVSRLSRQLDSDSYGDAIWGIVTGYEPEDALRAISESLTIKTVLAASSNLSYEPPIQRFHQAIGMSCDSYTKTDYLFADNLGKIYSENVRPGNEQDRIKLVSKWLNAESLNIEIPGRGKIDGPVDCIITGGHGNVDLWQCHYPEAGTEGYMRSSGGKLYGSPYSGESIQINAPTPKVYWFASNCLMGNPNTKDNVVYAAFKTGHAVQMFGFVNNSSSGNDFMAWGVYDRVTKCAGIYTLPQGFFLSNNNAMFELNYPTKQINSSLVQQFMDSTVFYGDPAAEVKFQDLGDSAKVYNTNLSLTQSSPGVTLFTYTIKMVAHDLEYGSGYCYQFRPMCMLPVRIDPASVKITQNEGHKAEITDNLLIWELLSQGEKLERGKTKVLSWTAKIIDDRTGKAINCPGKLNKNKPVLMSSKDNNNIVFNILNLPKGRFKMQVIDLTGKLIFSDEIKSTGLTRQSLVKKYSLDSGIFFTILKQNDFMLKSVLLVQ